MDFAVLLMAPPMMVVKHLDCLDVINLKISEEETRFIRQNVTWVKCTTLVVNYSNVAIQLHLASRPYLTNDWLRNGKQTIVSHGTSPLFQVSDTTVKFHAETWAFHLLSNWKASHLLAMGHSLDTICIADVSDVARMPTSHSFPTYKGNVTGLSYEHSMTWCGSSACYPWNFKSQFYSYSLNAICVFARNGVKKLAKKELWEPWVTFRMSSAINAYLSLSTDGTMFTTVLA